MRLIFISKKNEEKHMQTIEALTHFAIEYANFELAEAGVDLMGDFFGLKGLQYGKSMCAKRIEEVENKLKGD